jgi:hypothetical protein
VSYGASEYDRSQHAFAPRSNMPPLTILQLLLAWASHPAATAGDPHSQRILELPGLGTANLQRLPDETCVTPELVETIRREVGAARAGGAAPGITSTKLAGPFGGLTLVLRPPFYPFYPQGGTLYRDVLTGNFVDLDPAVGSVLNYLCESYGNDGHQGIDSGGLTWEEMAIGQPVFAALDGIAVSTNDGDPDTNTSCQPGGNFVIIDHGSGREAWYLHLKNGSVAVSTGTPVRAGDPIGLVASSGCSFGPHLHFQSMQNGKAYEPFRGPCKPAPLSGWKHQIDPPASGAFVRDMGVTTQDIGAAPGLPNRAPTDNQIPLSAGGNIYYWIQMGNLPPDSYWEERYVRPDGSTEYTLGPFDFGNPTTFQSSQYWFHRVVGGMATTTGTWRIQFEVNGILLVDAPVEVVAAVNPLFNRPPESIDAALDPPAAAPGQALFARLDAAAPGTGYRDRDWDIVRYRYLWKVNGVPTRDVVSIGMADVLSARHVKSGDSIQVTITAGDGFGGGLGATAPTVVLSTTVP